MPSTHDAQQPHPRRPAPVARHSSTTSLLSRSQSLSQPQSPSEASSSHKQHYKPQRHVVGGHGRPSARTPSGKNLSKLTKNAADANAPNASASKHHVRSKSGDSNGDSSSPRPTYAMKRNSSAFVIPRNTSHSALKKNLSSGHLSRHSSSKNVMKPARQAPTAKRTRSHPSAHSERPSPEQPHPTVRFALGDDVGQGEQGDEHDGDEWTEESASASPHTTRSSTPARQSLILPPPEGEAAAQGEEATSAQETSSEAESSKTVVRTPVSPRTRLLPDRTVTVREINGSSSYHSSRPPDADAITSRLLQRAPHSAAPQVSTITATVTPESSDLRSLSHSQGSTLADGTPGRDLVSRFINTSGSGGTPRDGHLLQQHDHSTHDPSDMAAHKRNKSTPNFAVAADKATGAISPASSQSRTLSHHSGTSTPTELPPSRTQQKLLLQRASSNIEPQKHIPAVLPRGGASQILGHGVVSFTSTEGGALPTQIQGLFTQATKEYHVVHRYRNPVADAIVRLGEMPGMARQKRIPGLKGAVKGVHVNGSGDGKYGLSQSYRSREDRQNERDGKHNAGGGPAAAAADKREADTKGHKARVSFELPTPMRPQHDEDEDHHESYGSDAGRIVRDEAYEICRRLWEIGEVAEGG